LHQLHVVAKKKYHTGKGKFSLSVRQQEQFH